MKNNKIINMVSDGIKNNKFIKLNIKKYKREIKFKFCISEKINFIQGQFIRI